MSGDSKLPGIYGDEDRLIQVFRNLLNGAVKLSNNGRIIIATRKKGDMLIVSIRHQVDPTEYGTKRYHYISNGAFQTSRHVDERGLDLLLSRRIVELHGGKVLFSDGRGYSGEVSVSLPIRPAWASLHR